MRPVTIERAENASHAIDCFGRIPETSYIVGGTSLVDQMKLDIARPAHLVDLGDLRRDHSAIIFTSSGLSIGAFATMTELVDDSEVGAQFPVISEALRQAASPQIRNMASIGGTLLQRTRCSYFRDRHSACNKRSPGSGCGAIGGDDRSLAVLGISQNCIANYPGDLAVALTALDASITVQSASGVEFTVPIEDFYKLPGDTPHIETALAPGDLIMRVNVPRIKWAASTYVKSRDRASYAFALASAAVALNLDKNGQVSDVRIALGGLAAKPWRCRGAEDFLLRSDLTNDTVRRAGEICMIDASPSGRRAFKVELGVGTIVRAIFDAADIARSGSL